MAPQGVFGAKREIHELVAFLEKHVHAGGLTIFDL